MSQNQSPRDGNRSGGNKGGLPNFFEVLDSKYLLVLVTALFFFDLAMPDPFPFVDEIVLGGLALLIARWQNRPKVRPEPARKPPSKNVTETA